MASSSPLFSISRSSATLLVALWVVGCGPTGGPGSPDSGSPRDAGRSDAVLPDGGAADAGGDAAHAACTTPAECASGQDCCAGRCTELQGDPDHCSQCGLPCGPSEFCAQGVCRLADFSQLCRLPLATVVLDGIGEDDTAGRSMGTALVTHCAPSVSQRSVEQASGGVLGSDGAPLALGELLVMGGGSFRQQAVRWLEQSGNAHVSDTSTVTQAIFSLRDGGVVSSLPFTSLGLTHDRVVVQLVRAPSGSLVLSAAGFEGAGTLAAAHYFVETLLPARATLTTAWYVIDWEDLDASGGPSAADRYAVIASGF